MIQVNLNFARCAVRHFVSAHLTKNHVLPRGALPHTVREYNSHFANESSLQVKYSVASKRFMTITKCFNEKWHPKEKRETYIFTFNNEAWKSLSQAEKDKHTLSGCKACQKKYPEVVNTFLKLQKESSSTPNSLSCNKHFKGRSFFTCGFGWQGFERTD